MKFSVIIPLYNKAPYIRKALESVLAQTYTDYELIIVDDGSTDGSAEIAEAFLHEAIGTKNSEADLSSPPRLIASSPYRLLKQKNAGVSAARNNGFSVSSAEYLAFLDADDWWEPTYLERMAQLITDYPDAGLYASNYVYYKPGKTHVALNIPTGYINYPKAYYESNAMPVTSITAIIPRKVFDEMGGFPLGIKLGEDFLLWSKIALRYPVAFLNEALAWYNNDVPATLRATRNLHAPEHHMLFRLELAFGDSDKCKEDSVKCKGKEDSKADNQASSPNSLIALSPTTSIASSPYRLNEDWQALLDKLRINGLLEYWLDKRYHNLAAEELANVDWSQQPDSVKRIYKMPLWLLKLEQYMMQVGSRVKQRLVKIVIKRKKQ